MHWTTNLTTPLWLIKQLSSLQSSSSSCIGPLILTKSDVMIAVVHHLPLVSFRTMQILSGNSREANCGLAISMKGQHCHLRWIPLSAPSPYFDLSTPCSNYFGAVSSRVVIAVEYSRNSILLQSVRSRGITWLQWRTNQGQCQRGLTLLVISVLWMGVMDIAQKGLTCESWIR